MKVAGFGFRKDAPYESFRAALQQVEGVGGPVTLLATVAAKAMAPALQRLATERGMIVLGVAVAGIDTPTRSARVQALYGTGSVAEAAALAAAGANSTLIVGRMDAPDGTVTCAMALGKGAIE
ncbi:cobalamin biosynthesis protein [Pseudotabrizicola alkalilacus]|uniref:Precorrin methylase n=1 Tax=Pseudotabrizicola alkalilacus TaxID=2305252 RepID=A0A411Z693_9RHOB|nr:cobalamin biosynthesis protein [Pseudotabrizicola alkalilacus]RGP38610.1 precorrin methylase [Pseudotabrizicola alkalilacus]